MRLDRMRAGRAGLAPDRMIDVHFDYMDRDWRATMARVYGFLDLDIEPALDGMADYLERSRELKRHPHAYSLAAFGLDESDVLDRLADYVDGFGVTMEGAHPAGRRVRA